jgi:non-heme chloroperoxidase
VKNIMLCLVAVVALSASELYAQDQVDNSPHTVQFVTVEPGVKLEVLDWGGSGTPLIFLAGAGDTAHRFDNFAPQFTRQHHVYGITRRGTGASSKPLPANGNYSADHLGDDILAVMQALNIERPVLVGHSIAGQELSSIGSRFPAKVSGLIYLDAATGFAFYDPAHPPVEIEMSDIKKRIDEIETGGVDEQKKLLELEAAIAKFETVLHQSNAAVANMPPVPPRSPSACRSTPPFRFPRSRSTPAHTTGTTFLPTNQHAKPLWSRTTQRAVTPGPMPSAAECPLPMLSESRTRTTTCTSPTQLKSRVR